MAQRPGVVERAYQLADAGEVQSLRELEVRLSSEGYSDARRQLDGPSLRRQLRMRWTAASRTAAEPTTHPATP